jgi:hypothetical protein
MHKGVIKPWGIESRGRRAERAREGDESEKVGQQFTGSNEIKRWSQTTLGSKL